MTKEDNELLLVPDERHSVYPTEYGYFLYVSEELQLEKDAPYIYPKGLSDSFYEVLKYAREHDCDYVMFDCDGETVDGLTMYEW